MISLEILEEPDSLWNRRLQSSPHGTIYQTKEYGSYIQSRLKSKPLFLTFNSENGEIMAQLLAFQTFKGTKKINKLFGRGLVYSLAIKTSLLPKFIYWNFGPVILNSENPLEVLDKLLPPGHFRRLNEKIGVKEKDETLTFDQEIEMIRRKLEKLRD